MEAEPQFDLPGAARTLPQEQQPPPGRELGGEPRSAGSDAGSDAGADMGAVGPSGASELRPRPPTDGQRWVENGCPSK